MTEVAIAAPVLSTRRGKAVLALLLSIGFLDFVDASIVNVALPSIRADLGFTYANLQWVLGGYLLTYGGLLLLGGRLADLYGRRRLVTTGTMLFLASSIAGGAAQTAGVLVGARLAQGAGAALMLPAALSILTTTFSHPVDRARALGVWGALAGLGSAVGVLLGGVLSDYLSWRWVFFVNPPVALLALVAIFRLLPADGPRHRGRIDYLGAILATAGMLLLVYTIVEAPLRGWGDARTVTGLVGAASVLGTFVAVELNQRDPLFPFSIFELKGLGEANLTQVIAMGAFYSMFLFATLYMQNVLEFSKLKAGVAYLPTTFGVAVAAGIGSKLVLRIGTRPIIVLGSLLGAAGMAWMSLIPVHGTWTANLFGPLEVMAFGIGFVFFGVTTAAQAGVPEQQAGMAAAMINASTWIGSALGVAIFSAMATSRTGHRLAHGASQAAALTSGFRLAFGAASIGLVMAAIVALRSRNAAGEDVVAPTTMSMPEADPEMVGS